MADPTQAGERQPSQEELRAYLEQLREAEAAEVIAQAFSMVGAAAEVKLGRRDARVLIDALAALVDATAAALPADLVERMREGVGQLQLAQVQAERQAAQEGAPTSRGGPAAPPQAPSEQGAGAGRDAQGERQMTDRLWIPGRDPGR